MDPDADTDPAIFVIDPQDANKTNLKKVFILLFLKVQEAQKHTDPTDPDSQHWFIQVQDELLV